MTTQIGQVKQVLRSYAIEIQTDSKTDLKESEVTMKLRKAMGANCKFSKQYVYSKKKTDAKSDNRRPSDVGLLDHTRPRDMLFQRDTGGQNHS
jgi:hypothetical protein